MQFLLQTNNPRLIFWGIFYIKKLIEMHMRMWIRHTQKFTRLEVPSKMPYDLWLKQEALDDKHSRFFTPLVEKWVPVPPQGNNCQPPSLTGWFLCFTQGLKQDQLFYYISDEFIIIPLLSLSKNPPDIKHT